MGRAIDQDNRLDNHEKRLKLLEDALTEMIQTKVHHVDLTDVNTVKIEGVEVGPDEEFTPPVRKHKSIPKTKKTKTATVG